MRKKLQWICLLGELLFCAQHRTVLVLFSGHVLGSENRVGWIWNYLRSWAVRMWRISRRQSSEVSLISERWSNWKWFRWHFVDNADFEVLGTLFHSFLFQADRKLQRKRTPNSRDVICYKTVASNVFPSRFSAGWGARPVFAYLVSLWTVLLWNDSKHK